MYFDFFSQRNFFFPNRETFPLPNCKTLSSHPLRSEKRVSSSKSQILLIYNLFHDPKPKLCKGFHKLVQITNHLLWFYYPRSNLLRLRSPPSLNPLQFRFNATIFKPTNFTISSSPLERFHLHSQRFCSHAFDLHMSEILESFIFAIRDFPLMSW